MQLRQLADIAFLLQSYDLAFQSYHQVKKDFQSASTWLYYAGAVVSDSSILAMRECDLIKGLVSRHWCAHS